MSSHCKTTQVSPSFRDQPCLSVGVCQGGCVTQDQGQMLGLELSLVEMSDVEFTHLQHLIQSQMEPQAALPDEPDARPLRASVIIEDATETMSPVSQAIDLSTSTEEHGLVMPGEKTPTSFVEVPGYVLARAKREDVVTDPRTCCSSSSQKQSRSASRVCLETRFNSLSADTPRQLDIQSAVPSNLVTVFQQSTEAQDGAIHPQMPKWMTSSAYRTKPYEVSSPFVGNVLNPVTNTCEQVVSHIPRRIVPKHQDDAATSAASRTHGGICNPHFRKGAKTVKSGSSTKTKTQAHISPGQRREKHNRKERERRRMIRQCCDELNMLVPFCNSGTDKVSTLLWTTAFLKYINESYGDTLKEKFEQTLTNERGHPLKPGLFLSHDLMQRGAGETLAVSLAVEH